MSRYLELTLANGNALDIPPSSVTLFEAMHRGKNANFPEARSFIRYTLGQDDRIGLLSDSFEDLLRLLDVNVRPGVWVLLTREDGDRVALRADDILAREAVETEKGACKLVFAMGASRTTGELIVRETRDEVKKAMEPPAPEPEAEIDPKPARAARAKRGE